MKVKYKKTGQIYDMPDNAQVDTSQFDLVDSGQQIQSATSSNQTNYITGHSPQEHIQALNAARMAGDKAAEADILDNYTKEYQYQKDISSGEFDSPEQQIEKKAKLDELKNKKTVELEKAKLEGKAKTYKNDVINLANNLKEVIANKDKYSKKEYEAIKDSLTAQLTVKQKEAANFGASLTGNELALLAGELPVRTDIGWSAGSLVKQLFTGQKPTQTGRLVDNDEQINRKLDILIPGLKGEKVTPEAFKKSRNVNNSVLDKILGYLEETAGNAPQDAGNILNSILGMPRGIMDTASQRVQEGKMVDPLSMLIAIGGEMGKGYLSNLNKDIGSPLEGGDILSRAGENFKQRPVGTALDILPFLKLKGASASKVAPVADTGGAGGLTQKLGEGMQGLAEGTNELITGGGTKNLITKNVNLDEARSLSNSQLKYGISGKPTDKLKMVRTQEALTEIGQKLEKTYKNSDATWQASDLGNRIRKMLIDEYGVEKMKSIDEVIKTITRKGKYDLTRNDSTLSATDLWELKKSGDKFGKAAYNIPETGPMMKDMAEEITSLLRNELSTKVKEAVPELRDYGNLNDYLKSLEDPKGLDTQGMGLTGTILKAATGGVKTGSQALNQILYNIGNKLIMKNKRPINYTDLNMGKLNKILLRNEK